MPYFQACNKCKGQVRLGGGALCRPCQHSVRRTGGAPGDTIKEIARRRAAVLMNMVADVEREEYPELVATAAKQLAEAWGVRTGRT